MCLKKETQNDSTGINLCLFAQYKETGYRLAEELTKSVYRNTVCSVHNSGLRRRQPYFFYSWSCRLECWLWKHPILSPGLWFPHMFDFSLKSWSSILFNLRYDHTFGVAPGPWRQTLPPFAFVSQGKPQSPDPLRQLLLLTGGPQALVTRVGIQMLHASRDVLCTFALMCLKLFILDAPSH